MTNKNIEDEYFEIVNWKKAQPKMKGSGNDWMKLYTSLLDHDGFAGLNDSARMLIVALWLYAARSGMHIFPADPKWIAKKIPMLNNKPNLKPLLEATDCYGNPTPFISYCKPPKAKKSKSTNKAQPIAKKTTKKKSKKEESRVDKKRAEETDQKKPLRVSEEIDQKKKERIIRKSQQTEAVKSEKPENPMESDVGSALKHHLPRPTRSANNSSKLQRIGNIIDNWIPDHWQDTDAESFGWEIVRALGYPDNPENMASRSEWGAFASWWFKVKKSASILIIDELRKKAIQKAIYLRTKDKSAKNRSSVWFFIMNEELKKYGVSINISARASPR